MMAQFDNGHDALSWLEHHSPDVLLTDLELIRK
jgi:YesN/AraC family two-component response regulator